MTPAKRVAAIMKLHRRQVVLRAIFRLVQNERARRALLKPTKNE